MTALAVLPFTFDISSYVLRSTVTLNVTSNTTSTAPTLTFPDAVFEGFVIFGLHGFSPGGLARPRASARERCGKRRVAVAKARFDRRVRSPDDREPGLVPNTPQLQRAGLAPQFRSAAQPRPPPPRHALVAFAL